MMVAVRQRLAAASRGWGVVVLGFATLAISFSARGALSVAMPSWSQEFGWSRGSVSAVAAVALLVMAVVAPFAGSFVDRRGSRLPLTAGLTSIAIGITLVTLAGPAKTSWLLPIGFGVVAAVGFGLIAQHVIAASIAQRFEANRGVAIGVGTSGSTAGQLLLMPVMAALMTVAGWRSAFFLLVVASAVLVPVVWFALAPGERSGQSRSEDREDAPALSVWGLLRDPAFQAVFWSYTICGFTTSGVIETHLLPYASFCGIAPVPSASAYGLLSGLNLIGMISAGWLADRAHRPFLLMSIYLVRAAAFWLLMNIGDSYPLLLMFSILFGLFDYSTVPVTASYVASRLGVRNLGLAMGVLSAGHAVGGALGAWIGGLLFDLSGGYQVLWLMSIGLALAAVVIVAPLSDDGRRRLPPMRVGPLTARPRP